MIDTQAIRKKILDLALRGKLTEQLPEDGTGQELFQHIKERKATLAGTGKTKKQESLIPLSEEDIPFEIPDNWQWVRLGDITSKITSGSTPTGGKKSNAYVDKGFCLFREQNIYNDGIHSEGMVYITEQLLDTRENSTVIAKDILLNITGGSIGRCAIVPDDFSKGSINQHILIIRMVEEETRFFTHLVLCSPYAQNHIKSKAVGDKDGFSGGRCKYMPVPLPPLPVQKRIVSLIHSAFSVLDTIDTLQSQYQENLATLKNKIIDAGIQGKLTEQLPEDGTAEELYQQIQQEKLTLEKAGKIKKSKPLPPISDEEKPFDIPDNWKFYKLGDLARKITDGEHQTPRRVKEYQGYYLLSARNVRNGYIDLQDVDYVDAEEFARISPRCNPGKNDVLISCSGSIGRCAVVADNNMYCMVRSAAMLSPIKVDSKYIMFAVQSSYVQGQIQDKAKQTLQANLFQDAIKNLIVPLPPLAEQKRIVARLEELLAVCGG